MTNIAIQIPLELLNIEECETLAKQLEIYGIDTPIDADNKVLDINRNLSKDSNVILFLERFSNIVNSYKFGLKYRFDKKEQKLVERGVIDLPTIITLDLEKTPGLEFTLRRLHEDGFGIGKFIDSKIYFAYDFGKRKNELFNWYERIQKISRSKKEEEDVNLFPKIPFKDLDLVELVRYKD